MKVDLNERAPRHVALQTRDFHDVAIAHNQDSEDEHPFRVRGESFNHYFQHSLLMGETGDGAYSLVNVADGYAGPRISS